LGRQGRSTISSFNDHPTKLTTMFAAGEKIDVSQSSPFSFPNFVNQGLAEPIDLPGAADYQGFHAVHQAGRTIKKTMACPTSPRCGYGTTTPTCWRNSIDKPPRTTNHRALRQSQKDGVSRYPSCGSPASTRAVAGHLVPDDLEQGQRLL
jgi:hypothetical protein